MERFEKVIFRLLVAFLCIACDQDDITCLRAEGPVVNERRRLDDFNAVFFNDVGNLHISQGNEQDVIIKSQKVVIDELEFRVIDQELRISLNRCFNGDTYELDIFITVPDIEKIEMAGTGSVLTETPVDVDNLEIVLSGVTSDFDMQIDADSLTTFLTGTGNIEYMGNTGKHRVLLSGAGDIEAYNLTSDECFVTLNGTGDTRLYVNDLLDARINGVGNVYYKGSPAIVSTGDGVGNVIDDN